MRANILHVDPTKFNTVNSLLYACCRGCENEKNEYSSDPKDLEKVDGCLSCMDKLDRAYRNRDAFVFNRKTGEIIRETQN